MVGYTARDVSCFVGQKEYLRTGADNCFPLCYVLVYIHLFTAYKFFSPLLRFRAFLQYVFSILHPLEKKGALSE
jgi:hypothetical protein